MGDSFRNLEDQIRGVEEQIRLVEEQIHSMEQKIESVEDQIETCSDIQEIARLEGKEAQLRDEKAQLRGKEVQPPEQIQQGRDKCTEFDWLRQELPSWDSGNCSKTPNTTQKERMYTPVRLEYWDVVTDVEDYLNRADKLNRIYEKVDNVIVTIGKQNSKVIADNIVASTCNFVSKKKPGSLVTYIPEANLVVPPEPLAEGGD